MTEASTTEVEGIVVSNSASTSASCGTLVVQTEDSAVPTSITVPTTVDATAAFVGARVHAVATIDPTTGALTLVRLDVQQQDGQMPGGLVVEGSVVSITPATASLPGVIIVQPGDGAAAITISLPMSVDVTGIAPGARVKVSASLVGGVLTASSITTSN